MTQLPYELLFWGEIREDGKMAAPKYKERHASIADAEKEARRVHGLIVEPKAHPGLIYRGKKQIKAVMY